MIYKFVLDFLKNILQHTNVSKTTTVGFSESKNLAYFACLFFIIHTYLGFSDLNHIQSDTIYSYISIRIDNFLVEVMIPYILR